MMDIRFVDACYLCCSRFLGVAQLADADVKLMVDMLT
jgi:hypothetical protein